MPHFQQDGEKEQQILPQPGRALKEQIIGRGDQILHAVSLLLFFLQVTVLPDHAQPHAILLCGECLLDGLFGVLGRAAFLIRYSGIPADLLFQGADLRLTARGERASEPCEEGLIVKLLLAQMVVEIQVKGTLKDRQKQDDQDGSRVEEELFRLQKAQGRAVQLLSRRGSVPAGPDGEGEKRKTPLPHRSSPQVQNRPQQKSEEKCGGGGKKVTDLQRWEKKLKVCQD